MKITLNSRRLVLFGTLQRIGLLVGLLVFGSICSRSAPQGPKLMYVGTLDHKLLVLDEDQAEVVGEIPLTGIPRNTALSADHKLLYIIDTNMLLEIVDLASRKVVSKFNLADGRSSPMVFAFASDPVNPGMLDFNFSGLAVDPNGRYLYTTLRVAVKDIDEYRIEPAKFVAIDLQNKNIAKAFDFPTEVQQGFGFLASYKVSPDGKLLYVFDDDILIFDLATFKQVDRIPLSKPPYPGESPFRLSVTDDPFDDPSTVTSVFISVDSVVHKGTLGIASLNLTTRAMNYKPIGPALPMLGFLVSPDRKRGYSVMFDSALGNRRTEWWVWDLQTHRVIQKREFESRPTFRFGISGDGTKLYVYGSGSTIEVFDAATLTSQKFLNLNKDMTTNIVILPR
jgi:DNA-binding beta-propeller fold protein YncE